MFFNAKFEMRNSVLMRNSKCEMRNSELKVKGGIGSFGALLTLKPVSGLFAGMLAAAVILMSCQPSIVGNDVEDIGESPNYYDFSQIFETFWRGMDRNYAYWSEEPSSLWDPLLDRLPPEQKSYILRYPESFWDKIYDHFKPQFEALGTFPVAAPNDPKFVAAVVEAYDLFYQMTFGLRDGHFRIAFANPGLYIANPDPLTAAETPYVNLPTMWPHQSRLMGHFAAQPIPYAGLVFMYSNLSGNGADPYTYDFVTNVLESKYLDASSIRKYRIDTRFVSGRISDGGKDILYLYFDNCRVWNIMEGKIAVADAPGLRAVINGFFDDLADRSLNVKGIIVDIRGNTGGDRADAGYIFGRMIDAPLTFAHSRVKSGEGRLDYGPWAPVQIMPAPASEKRSAHINVPVVLLVDKTVNSSSEFITKVVKNMPNGTVVGETTGGALTTTSDKLGYAGGFSGSLFWTNVSMAATQYRNTDGTITEGFGIPPDIEVPMSAEDWMAFYGVYGADNIRDKVLDAGIAHIRTVNP